MGNRIQKEKQLICIVENFFQKGMNERDSVVVGIVGMCITGCLMELWVTLFEGRGKAAL